MFMSKFRPTCKQKKKEKRTRRRRKQKENIAVGQGGQNKVCARANCPPNVIGVVKCLDQELKWPLKMLAHIGLLDGYDIIRY